jgi:simple sugar transport system permease protein
MVPIKLDTDKLTKKSFFKTYELQFFLLFSFLVLIIVFMAFSPGTFLSKNIYISYMSTVPFTGIMALGLTLLIIGREMDLSFPSVMAVSSYGFAWLYSISGNALLALLFSLIIGVFAGMINGILVVKVGIPSIVATIGMQFFWRGLLLVISQGLAISLNNIKGTVAQFLFVGRIGKAIPFQMIWFLLIAILIWWFLNRHSFCEGIYFIGDNEKTAKIMGINVGKTKIILFIIMGVLAALAGTLVCVEMVNWWPTQGEGYLLLVFASVFVGGNAVTGGEGTIFGTIIGSIIIGMIEAGIISAGLSGFWTRLVYGLIVVVAVVGYSIMRKRK